MSTDEKMNEEPNFNTNNSNKTNEKLSDGLISNDDAPDTVSADVKENKCSENTELKPDKYEAPSQEKGSNLIDEKPEKNTEEGDKWVLPSPTKEISNGAEECNEETTKEDQCAEKDKTELSENNMDTDDTVSEKQTIDMPKPESSSSCENNSNTIIVDLPPIDGEGTSQACQDNQNGALSKEHLKPDIVENTENRSQSPMDDKSSTDSLEGVYQIKWVKFKGKDVPIITQNENGPCPLLAIMNVLLLKGKIKFPSDTEIMSSEQIMAHLGECILANKPQNFSEVVQLNYEQNMHDAMAVFHKLQTGLDVNVRFNGVNEFEYTPECIIFDLLSIALYHGWLVDPQNDGEVSAIGNCSYNQLVEKIISQRSSEKDDLVTEALVAEGFLDRTASQLTYHGLCELSSTVKPDQLCVFFRNNHFCTLYRHKDELFLLVTDQGFLHERNVVWETLNNVEGDHYFVDSDFHTYTKPAPTQPVLPPDMDVNSDEQVNHDYLLAMSLQQEQQMNVEQMEIAEAAQQRPQISDAELAARLQAEEDAQAAHAAQQQHAQEPGQHRGPAVVGHQGHARPRERERPRDRDRSRDKDSNCCIL